MILFLKSYFVSANSADPDEKHYSAFHLGLHCLSKYPFKGSGPQMVKSVHYNEPTYEIYVKCLKTSKKTFLSVPKKYVGYKGWNSE